MAYETYCHYCGETVEYTTKTNANIEHYLDDYITMSSYGEVVCKNCGKIILSASVSTKLETEYDYF